MTREEPLSPEELKAEAMRALRDRKPLNRPDLYLGWLDSLSAPTPADIEACFVLLRTFKIPWMTKKRHTTWANVRRIVAAKLRLLGDPAAVEPLCFALVSDPFPAVRAEAEEGLRSFGRAIVSPLLAHLEVGFEWRVEGMAAAIGLLGEQGDLRATGLLSRVMTDEIPQSTARWRRQALWRSGATLWPILLVLALIVAHAAPYGAASVAGFFGTLFMGGPLYFSLYTRRREAILVRERAALSDAAATALLRLRDLRAIPLLVHAAFDEPAYHGREAARWALAGLLPSVSAADRERMEGLTALMAAGLHPEDPALTLVLLHALEQVGTGAALPAVERAAGWTKAPDLAAAALRIAPALRERARIASLPARLVRPAEPAEPGQLLRPEAPAEQLVRPEQEH